MRRNALSLTHILISDHLLVQGPKCRKFLFLFVRTLKIPSLVVSQRSRTLRYVQIKVVGCVGVWRPHKTLFLTLLRPVQKATGITFEIEVDWAAIAQVSEAKGYKDRAGECINWYDLSGHFFLELPHLFPCGSIIPISTLYKHA